MFRVLLVVIVPKKTYNNKKLQKAHAQKELGPSDSGYAVIRPAPVKMASHAKKRFMSVVNSIKNKILVTKNPVSLMQKA